MVTIQSGSKSHIRSIGQKRDPQRHLRFCRFFTVPKVASLLLSLGLLLIVCRLDITSDGRLVRGFQTVGDGRMNNNGPNQDNGVSTTKMVVLSLQLHTNRSKNDAHHPPYGTLDATRDSVTREVRLHLFGSDAPQATEYIMHLATSKTEQCSKCTLYRGEPVPPYWGSEEYPDRYFDHGRWGPPYALVQGAFLVDDSDSSSTTVVPPPAEQHRPIIQRGMVAWAGGQGGPHFFVALADHPEWGNGHTVFAAVGEEDMKVMDSLVLERPLVSTKPKRPPIVTNFLDAIPIRLFTHDDEG
jgi:hypothetical protein